MEKMRAIEFMEFVDKVVICLDCNSEFVFTADEQHFFRDKEFVHDPRHCRKCRATRSRGEIRSRPETRTTCAKCGLETTVPFRPTKGLPVLCRSCFQLLRNGTESDGKESKETVEKELVQSSE
jgi:CxxC-x17-CxxC domain-containing protein